MNKKIFHLLTGMAVMALAACENSDWSFDDYGTTTVYFPYQYPVRTIVLGNDEAYDNSNDREHKCIIYATMGGVYDNNSTPSVDIRVDESLCNGLTFSDNGDPVRPLPATHYTLSSNRITLPKGEMRGGVEVYLTDAFFADPLSIGRNYVIPLVMSNVQHADSILSGTPNVANPDRCVSTDWSVQPMDYVLYAVKYVNPWDGIWLRRGLDNITAGGRSTVNVRHKAEVTDNETFELTTLALTKAGCTVTTAAGTCDLVLNFNGDNCTVTSATNGCTATGTGTFVEHGELSFNEKYRDVLYLDYTLDFGAAGQVATRDTLVMRDRQNEGRVLFTVTK